MLFDVGLMSNVDEAQFGAMLKDAQQQVTDDISRYLQQTPPVPAQLQPGAPRLIPTPQQQAQLQQQYAQLQQYQVAQQQALQQQSQSQIMMEMEDPEDSDDDGNGRSEKRAGRRKIRIEYIEDKSRRHITFSKRKAGIMKKAYELSTLTGTQVLLLVASETGHVYTFATPKLQPLITKPEGKNLIQACLNAPDGGDYSQQHAGYEDDNVDDRPVLDVSLCLYDLIYVLDCWWQLFEYGCNLTKLCGRHGWPGRLPISPAGPSLQCRPSRCPPSLHEPSIPCICSCCPV